MSRRIGQKEIIISVFERGWGGSKRKYPDHHLGQWKKEIGFK